MMMWERHIPPHILANRTFFSLNANRRRAKVTCFYVQWHLPVTSKSMQICCKILLIVQGRKICFRKKHFLSRVAFPLLSRSWGQDTVWLCSSCKHTYSPWFILRVCMLTVKLEWVRVEEHFTAWLPRARNFKPMNWQWSAIKQSKALFDITCSTDILLVSDQKKKGTFIIIKESFNVLWSYCHFCSSWHKLTLLNTCLNRIYNFRYHLYCY